MYFLHKLFDEFFSPVKRHPVRTGYGCAGDGGGVFCGEGLLGVNGGRLLGQDGDGLAADTGPVGVIGGEMPGEGAVAELLVLVDLLLGHEAGVPVRVEAAVVVSFGGAAALDADAGVSDGEEGADEGGVFALDLPGKVSGGGLPVGDVQPAALAEGGDGGVQLQVDGVVLLAAQLGVDAEHRAEGLVALGDDGAETVVVHPVGDNELLDFHAGDLLEDKISDESILPLLEGKHKGTHNFQSPAAP